MLISSYVRPSAVRGTNVSTETRKNWEEALRAKIGRPEEVSAFLDDVDKFLLSPSDRKNYRTLQVLDVLTIRDCAYELTYVCRLRRLRRGRAYVDMANWLEQFDAACDRVGVEAQNRINAISNRPQIRHKTRFLDGAMSLRLCVMYSEGCCDIDGIG